MHSLNQAGTAAATSTKPVSETPASQRQGNCTSDSFGIIAHRGLLSGTDMKPANTVTPKGAMYRPVAFRFQSRMIAGRRKAIVISASTFAYHVFMLVNASGEKRKFRDR